MKKQTKKIAKRFFSMLLAVILIFTCAPVQTEAANQTIEISVGETKTLRSSSLFQTTTWKSSDTDIVTVSNRGVLTGISAGTATVTATTKSGFFWFQSTSVKTYDITVTSAQTEEPDVPETPEEPAKTSVYVGETVSLTLKNANGTTTWKSSDKSIATVSNEGVVTGVAEGTATITATTKSGGFHFWGFMWGTKTTTQKFEIEVLANEIVEPEPDPTPDPDRDFFYVDFNANTIDDTVTNMPTRQEVKPGEYANEPESPARNGYEFAGWYIEAEPENLNNIFDFTNTPITADIVLYAGWICLSDTDSDGLVDGLEDHYETDINNPDTDNDTLSDYVEIVILGTDPLAANTDKTTDSDEDGIPDLEEIELGTNPGDKDTDSDSLTDYEEIELGTNPTNYDTDGDNVSDGTEVVLGTNPLIPDSSFDITATSEIPDSVRPFVEISLDGKQVDTLSVEPITDTNLFPENMPGYLGKAYNFSVAGEFESAKISFEFDASLLENGGDPAIFYFNEETQTLEELETLIEGNVASTVVTHFSTYVLIDREVHYDSFTWQDVWSTDGEFYAVEIVLVIDDSGSMDWNDEYNQRLVVAQNLIDKLPEYSKIGIVKFEDNTTLLTSSLTSDRAVAKAYLSTDYFESSGGTYMYTAINDSFDLFQSTEETTLKMMVILSDGDAHDTEYHSSTISSAINNNVRLYTVGLGDSTSYFTDYLQPLATQTSGEFYLAANADQLSSIYDDINKKIDLESHSDDDQIPDYYEDNMVSFNGMRIELDKYSSDTDGDGLKDNEEIKVELVYNEDRTKVYVKGILNSYPHIIDSDNDSINDYHDPNPMEFTITDRVLSWVEGLSYTNLAAYKGYTLGYAIKQGATIDGLSDTYVKYLKDAIIVDANNSGVGYWKDFWDSGLGYVALKFVRKTEPTAIVFALRGTEPDDDIANDAATDLVLGIGWDSVQSRNAFDAYKKIATKHSYDYYVTGHSLGGRLAQDVLYKTHNANEGGLFKEKANIPEPVHSATFNALGYNRLVYATLENDVLSNYKNKLTNFYYWLDLVGEGLGSSPVYKRAGSDAKLLCKDIYGTCYRDSEFDNLVNIRDCDYHGISHFHSDYDLLYANSDAPAQAQLPGSKIAHNFTYWVD